MRPEKRGGRALRLKNDAATKIDRGQPALRRRGRIGEKTVAKQCEHCHVRRG
jgi:hypothetical protein